MYKEEMIVISNFISYFINIYDALSLNQCMAKTNKMTITPSEDSAQSWHPHSLIRV